MAGMKHIFYVQSTIPTVQAVISNTWVVSGTVIIPSIWPNSIAQFTPMDYLSRRISASGIRTETYIVSAAGSVVEVFQLAVSHNVLFLISSPIVSQ